MSDNSVSKGTPINIIDTLSGAVTDSLTGFTTVNGMALNSKGTRLYVADNGAPELVTIDTSNHQRISAVSVRRPKDVLVAPGNASAHVATDGSWTLVNLANNVIAEFKTVTGAPTSIRYSPRYPRVYITHRESGRLIDSGNQQENQRPSRSLGHRVQSAQRNGLHH